MVISRQLGKFLLPDGSRTAYGQDYVTMLDLGFQKGVKGSGPEWSTLVPSR